MTHPRDIGIEEEDRRVMEMQPVRRLFDAIAGLEACHRETLKALHDKLWEARGREAALRIIVRDQAKALHESDYRHKELEEQLDAAL